MKKNTIISFVVFISLAIGFYYFNDQKMHKQNADKTFIYCLEQANSCFAVNYNTITDEEKTDYYIKATSNLQTAYYIFQFTSYYYDNGSNNELFDSISSLSSCMKIPNTRLKLVEDNRKLVYSYLTNIITNPKDQDSYHKLYRLTDEIYSHEKVK